MFLSKLLFQAGLSGKQIIVVIDFMEAWENLAYFWFPSTSLHKIWYTSSLV